MEKFFHALRKSIDHQNWHAVLVISLTLPDICSKYTNSGNGSQSRYVAWFDQFLLQNYVHPVGPNQEMHTFLSGEDCYALRCALLHEGKTSTITQRAQSVLEDFIFITPPPTGSIHRNQVDNKLQLQVDIFGQEVLSAAEKWWATLDAVSQNAINEKLLTVHETKFGFNL